MKFDISTSAFIQLINTLTAAGEKQNTFMVLENTRIIADENTQTVRFERYLLDTLGSDMGGNLKTTVLVQQQHAVVYEGGDVLAKMDKAKFSINSEIKKQCEIARFDGDKVELLRSNDTPLRIVPIHTYEDISEWPELPSDETSNTFATGIHNYYLKQAFTHTSDDGARPEFLCVRMGKDGKLCSTDGHRLALIKTQGNFPDNDDKKDDVLIRPHVYKILKTIPDDYTWDFFLGCCGQLELYTEIAGTIITIRQSKSNGQFPDFTRVIPNAPMDNQFHIYNAKDTKDGLKAALKAYPKNKNNAVKLCEDGSVVAQIEGKAYPTTVKIKPTKVNGRSICVNATYIIDALTLTGDDTTWSFIDADMPTLLEGKDGRTQVVVMPMQP